MPEEEGWSPVFTCRVEKKYRIWIPRTIRQLLNLYEGDYVEVKIRVVERKGLLRRPV
jgi:AbrB family looped-hinge helix DNA binding protein